VAADDITGANDIGICFANGGYRSAVFPLELIRDRDLQKEARGLDVIIIDTDSRFDDPGTAAAKVAAATQLLKELSCDRYFNKTCSVFRGNIGAEFDSMQDALGVTSSMVILGFPKNGRTTVDGVHYVYGKRLEDSQFRSDPIHPMDLSYLPDILARQSDRSVGLVTWKDLDRGVLHVRARKDELKRAGCAYVLFDIRSQDDLALVAEAVAEELGVDVVKSELLPADKVAEVERLLASKGEKERLAFVGDGINDAPVLSRADIGIAMGALGYDAAIEAADIVLMDDDPAKIATAINISRKTLGIVHQNIVFALAVKFACLGLGAFCFVNMWWAIFADVGVMIIAVLNATRTLKS